MPDWLADDVAVVTGGSSGNGRAISLTLAEHGANVVVADLQSDPRGGGVPTHEKIQEEYGQEAAYVECNVANVSNLRDAIDVADELGGVSIMVNNAGITHSDEFLETTEEDFDRIMDINVKGVFFGAQAAAESMVEAGRSGSIINMSSVTSFIGRGDGVRYSTSKGAVESMTYALADRLGPEGIRVNSIHPSMIETPMTEDDLELIDNESSEKHEQATPLGRIGQPRDVADTALYLASPLASFINGETMVVDGGVTTTMGGGY
ncbi:SDR family oxidoreductase [Haloterrigena sp. SYSU A121-1]|uniref:SDR family oxidoreductase n=1 Tax=Haloterrigena gelatinilytica TaxID=2741724 RepID=A0A8J8KHM5_9EURY|nr:SDR family oxidoreductase [Haloterrigena gelatinilytica]NUB93671.1 SDR family oxidoreductase [Haloterrigena gelatinilytica]